MSQKLRVGIIGRDLNKKGGGTKTYILNILKSLSGKKYEGHKFYLIHNCLEYKGHFPSFEETFIEEKNKLLFDYLYVPIWSRKNKLDIVFYPKSTIPFFVRGKKIVTVHDLAYFMPSLHAYTLLNTFFMKRMIKSSCKRADKLIVVSENTKRDIINILGINEEKIKVIYEAADEKYKIMKDKEKLREIKEKYNLSKKFILFTGGITPRKNLVRLIKTFNKISNDISHDLVLTGGKGWKNKEELALIKHNKKIKRLGFVADENMPYLYNLADIFIYPSLYEGFGLPVLETQACGCPVIASNVSSIPEVGGDSVLYIDPYNIEDIKEKMLRLAKNESLKKDLIRKGFKNVKRFSWDKAAKEILDVIE